MSVDPITGRVDFVPAACEAGAIANCLINRECQLDSLSPPSVGGSAGLMGDALGLLGSVTIGIDELNLCILIAVAEAFADAGCVLPTIDPELPEVDLTECIADLDRQIDEAAEPLGHLKDTFNITFNENGFPIRIQT